MADGGGTSVHLFVPPSAVVPPVVVPPAGTPPVGTPTVGTPVTPDGPSALPHTGFELVPVLALAALLLLLGSLLAALPRQSPRSATPSTRRTS